MALSDWFARLAEWSIVRRVLDVVFSARSRLHLVWLGRLCPERAQWRTLSTLVHRAARTPFGLDHDLSRIRTEADFRRLVPVRTPGELARWYSQPEAAWPGEVLAHGTSPDGRTQAITADLLALHRRGLRSALAIACAAQSRSGLFAGPVAWLGDGLSLTGDLEAAHGLRLPRLLRLVVSPPDHGPASLVIGPVSRVLASLEANPAPLAVLTWRQGEENLDELRRRLPSSTVVVEMLVRPEGTLAVESARDGLFRLLPEHGAFFEFVPLGAEGNAPRRTLAEVRLGEPYEMVVSSPAAWACRTGLGVCFDRLTPPLFHLVPVPTRPVVLPVPRSQPVSSPPLPVPALGGRPARAERG